MKRIASRARRAAALALFAVLVLAPVAGRTQVPQTISYQGSLTDLAGVPASGIFDIAFSLYDAASAGTLLWTETQNVTVTNGAFSVVLGADAVGNPLDAAIFENPLFLGVQLVAGPGIPAPEPEMTPRQALTAAGYGLRAKTVESDTLSGLSCAADELAKWDGAAWACAADTTLGEAEVEAFVTNGALDLAVGTTLGGAAVQTGSEADTLGALACADGQLAKWDGVSSLWVCAPDDDTPPLGEAEVEAFVTNGPIGLAAGSSVGGQGILTAVDWSIITGVPAGLDDGDDDALGPLSCLTAQVAKWNGIGWSCANDTDTHITPTELFLGVLAQDGAGSGLDADLLDGQHASGFATAAHNHGGQFVLKTGDTMSGALNVSNAGSSGFGGSFFISNAANNFTALVGSTNGGGDAVQAQQTGTGRAGIFNISNAANAQTAVHAQTNGGGTALFAFTTGGGAAGRFEIGNPANSRPAIQARSNGTGSLLEGFNSGNGPGVFVDLVSATNPNTALFAHTAGAGNTIEANQTGTGRAEWLRINNATSANHVLLAETNGLGPAGTFVITNSSNSNSAVSGSTNGIGVAMRGFQTGLGPAGDFQIWNASSTATALTVTNAGTGWAAEFRDGKGVFVTRDFLVGGATSMSGNLFLAANAQVAGDVQVEGSLGVLGGKFFVQPHIQDPAKEIVYVSMEGPEAAVFARGTARLENGRAAIELPEDFRAVAGRDDIAVQLTPRSLASKGLAAYQVSKERILVGELMDGQGSYEFDYFVTAKRAGFEAHQPVVDNTHFRPRPGETPEDFAARFAGDDPGTKAARAMMTANGILTPDGRLDETTAKELGWTPVAEQADTGPRRIGLARQ